MTGYKLDEYEQLAGELRGLLSKLEEARQWFTKQHKPDEAETCNKCMQSILKATFLTSKNTIITQQPVSTADKHSAHILAVLAAPAA